MAVVCSLPRVITRHLENDPGLYQGTTFSRANHSYQRCGVQPLQNECPQGLKPKLWLTDYGTAEAVP
jgi:hypothetical protein